MLKAIRKKISKISNYPFEIILVIFSLIFSYWIMFSTFSYENGTMLIASKAWSDFASTIPLIRSFSLGINFLPEYPLFPGEPIHYHFLFYTFVGMLEKIGVRIDYALNIPSSIGFFGLLLMIYFFAKKMFNNKTVGFLSVLFFLFNGSLSFVEFLKTHIISLNIFSTIVQNRVFPSFGPYDDRIVSAFWNLNIFTNQRHIASAFFVSFLIIYFLLKPAMTKFRLNYKSSFLLGIFLGLSFFFHLAVFLMTVVVIVILGVLFKKIRITTGIILITAGIIALPQYLYLQSGGPMAFKPTISIGYLTQNNLSIKSFIEYWAFNLGIHSVLIPLGFLFAPKNLRKILVSFFIIFIIGNVLQFSPEIAGNHKFFNYFMVIGVMFSAFALTKLWKYKSYLKPFVIVTVFFLTFSGIIDFFPIYNDHKIVLEDYPINQDIQWIKNNTPRDSVFLNTQYLYDPASLAGRKIFLGWPYFSWSAGYDTLTRDNLRKNMLNPIDINSFCKNAIRYNINYVELYSSKEYEFPINNIFFDQNLKKEYENTHNQFIIYSTKEKC